MSTPTSIEFFPPKTEAGAEKLMAAADQLQALNPGYFSVTYGAGGSTRDRTRQVVLNLLRAGYQVAPHLSFGTDDEDVVGSLLQDYVDAGINRLVALRGDAPSGSGTGRLKYAKELVEYTRQRFSDHFRIAVACYPEVHPEGQSLSRDIGFLKGKLDAGADYAVTQYFYNFEAFLFFRDACEKAGITQPIYPGIMPITNAESLMRFSANCGADIPRWLRYGLEDQKSEEDLLAFGEDVVTKLCEQLIAADIPGLHFYTLNRAEPTLKICDRLGLLSP
jgi:methylenetetrahydrofolate reductase (NADPH)